MLACSSIAPLKAAVLTNNIVLTRYLFGDDAIYQVTQPGDKGLFALGITTNSPGHYTISSAGIAELYSVHSAYFGLEFTPSYVQGDVPLLNNSASPPWSFQVSLAIGQSVLLAYWDDRYDNFPNPSTFMIPDESDGYGWFRLVRTPTGLDILDSATAVGGGIVVGTYSQIPEPTIGSLLTMAGLTSLALRDKFRNRS